MCGRFAMDDKVNAAITEFVESTGKMPEDWRPGWEPSWNIAPTENIPLLFESGKGEADSEYGMSESTRKAGLRNLADLGVLEAEGISVETGAGVRRRGRTNYSLLPVYEPPAPAAPAPTRPRQDPPA